jgi:hypothetical protein
MAEWSNAAVLKTVVPFRGTVGSNPTLSARRKRKLYSTKNDTSYVMDKGASIQMSQRIRGRLALEILFFDILLHEVHELQDQTHECLVAGRHYLR